MMDVKNGIAALYSLVEKYKLATPAPYVLANLVTYANTFIFKDWVFIWHLCVVIFLDTVLGVLVALKNKKFSSWGFGKVFTKISIYFVVLIATHNAGNFFTSSGVEFLVTIFDSTVYAAIMVREYLSLIEKMPALGIWNPPKWLFKRMQVWYETGETEAKQTDEPGTPPTPPTPQS